MNVDPATRQLEVGGGSQTFRNVEHGLWSLGQETDLLEQPDIDVLWLDATPYEYALRAARGQIRLGALQ